MAVTTDKAEKKPRTRKAAAPEVVQRLRIKVRAYEHKVLDASVKQILDTALRYDAKVAGWWVWGWLNAVRGVARTAPMMYLIPPVAGLFAWVLTGEQFSGVKLLGAGVALVGVAWAQFARASQRNKPS